MTVPMRNSRSISVPKGLGVVIATPLFLVLGCSGEGVPSSATQESQTWLPSGEPTQEGTSNVLEFRVLEGLKEFPYGKAARFDSVSNRLIVTIYSDGADIPAPELESIRAMAEELADGVPVTIEISSEDPPRAAK